MKPSVSRLAAVTVFAFSWHSLMADIDPVTPEPSGTIKVRFISFVVPLSSAGTNTAIRVRLASLHHPTSPPPGTPDFTMHEGSFRYLNSFGGSLVCVDNATFSTNYRCGQLGCDPEYRDWATDLSFAANPAQAAGLIHVTGSAVVPSSTFEVSSLDESCGMRPEADTCSAATAPLIISTARWGDAGGGGGGPPDGAANVVDCGLVFDVARGYLPGSLAERRAWLKSPTSAAANPINVIDCGLVVDATKGLPYPYTINECD